MSRIRFALILTICALFAAGCGTSVEVDTPTIPKPVTQRIPLAVAVRMPTEFDHYIHEEEVLGRAGWKIDLGHSNASLFKQLFAYMFDTVVVLSPDDDPRDFEFDALIQPSIEAFEFSTPEQSQSEAFAVWIRYRLLVFDSAGNRFANWPVSAYGKSQKEGLGSSASLRRAAILAMRDAAALMVTQMERATGLSALADGPLEKSLVEEFKPKVAKADEGLTVEDTARAVIATGLGGFPNEARN